MALIPTTAPEGPLTMSSKEIAELTGKEHKNVLTDIRNMLETLLNSAEFSAQYEGRDWSTFHGTYTDSTGRTLPLFNLPKDLTLTLVAGYNVTLRHRIVTRWMELEAQAVKPQVPALPDSYGPR